MVLDGNEYKMIVEFSPNMIWRAGCDSLCNYFNSKWLEFSGRTIEQEMGNGWAEGVHPDDLDRCLKIYTEAFANRVPFEMNYRLKRFDGEWRWINDRGSPYYNDHNEFEGYIGSCVDVTEKVEGQRLKQMAQKDGLTDINNRQYFEQLAMIEYEKAKRYNLDTCIILVDINSFKSINDQYGHQFGDKILKAFADFLRCNIRDFDILGRYGGDEFIIMLPNTDYDEATKLMIRIKEKAKELIFLSNAKSVNITFCYGISQMNESDKMENLIFRADQELYKQKSQKRA